MKTFSWLFLLALVASDLSADNKPDADALLQQSLKLTQQAKQTIADARVDGKNQKESLKAASDLLLKARGQLMDAKDELETRLKTFPVFIDRKDDADRYEQRARVLTSLIRTELEVASNSYTQATISPDSTSKDALYRRARDEFEAVYQKHRTLLAGQHARLSQARCLYALKQIPEALSILSELLAHRNQKSLRSLTESAMHLRLTCLNHPSRNDAWLARQEARDWLDDPEHAKSQTTSGDGIRWEFTLSLETIAAADETEDAERLKCLDERKAILKSLAGTKGYYQQAARAKLKSLQRN